MERYDYMEAMTADIKQYIDDCGLTVLADRDIAEQKLYDDLWTVDSVTGNGSGSYTFNRLEAEEYIAHNFDLLGEAIREFDCDLGEIIQGGPEACDVTIRCYLLGAALSRALDELEAEGEIVFEEEE